MIKKTLLLILGVLFFITLPGCLNNRIESNYSIIFNSSINDAFVDSPRYIFGNISISMSVLRTIIINKKTSKVESFIRDPFYDDKKNISFVKNIQIDTWRNKGYYMDDSIVDNDTGFSIMQFDLNTFDIKEIYREGFIWHKEVFLGLSKISDIKVSKEDDFSEKKTTNLNSSNRKPRYFVDKKNIYLIKENGVCKIDKKNKKRTELIKEDGIQSVSFDGLNIYFINNLYEILRYSTRTGKKVKLTDNKSTYSVITKSKIIYTNLNDKNCIYVMNKDGSDNHKIGDNRAKNLNFDSRYIYYSNEDDKQCLYRMKFDGSECEKMVDKPTYFVFTFKDYNKVFIWSNDIRTNSIAPFSVDKKDFSIHPLKF